MDKLLNEILLRIVGEWELELPHGTFPQYDNALKDRLRDLTSIALVNRKFRELANAVLYRTVPMETLRFMNQFKWVAERGDSRDMFDANTRFVRTILQDPSFGRAVHSISFLSWKCRSLQGYEYSRGVKNHGGLDQTCRDWIAAWEYSQPAHPTEHNLITPLIMSMSSLERVDTDRVEDGWIAKYLSGKPILDFIPNHEMNKVEERLPRLRDVCLRATGEGRKCCLSQIEPILWNHGLQKLTLVRFECSRNSLSRMNETFHTNISQIALLGCIIDDRGLQYLLRGCHNITDLRIELGVDGPLTRLSHLVYKKEIGDVLRENGQRLIRLDINGEFFNGTFDDPPQAEEPEGDCFGSLKNLISLRHLNISRQDLAGLEKTANAQIVQVDLGLYLPDGLETLHLRPHYAYTQHLNVSEEEFSMMDQCFYRESKAIIEGGKFPQLRSLVLELDLLTKVGSNGDISSNGQDGWIYETCFLSHWGERWRLKNFRGANFAVTMRKSE